MEATCTSATQPAGAGREDRDMGRTKPLSFPHGKHPHTPLENPAQREEAHEKEQWLATWGHREGKKRARKPPRTYTTPLCPSE